MYIYSVYNISTLPDKSFTNKFKIYSADKKVEAIAMVSKQKVTYIAAAFMIWKDTTKVPRPKAPAPSDTNNSQSLSLKIHIDHHSFLYYFVIYPLAYVSVCRVLSLYGTFLFCPMYVNKHNVHNKSQKGGRGCSS